MSERKILSTDAENNRKLNIEIHNRIYKWLVEHEKISQRAKETDVTNYLDCDYNAYIKQTNDGRAIKLQELISCAQKLGCTTDYLLGLSDNTSSNDNKSHSNEPKTLHDLIRNVFIYYMRNTCPEDVHMEVITDKKKKLGAFGFSERHMNDNYRIISAFSKYETSVGAFQFLDETQRIRLIDDILDEYIANSDDL